MESTEAWQNLMDTSYAKWPDGANQRQFIESLSELEQDAVLLGNFNYQVENGGARQWVDNGYALMGIKLLTTLEKVQWAETTSAPAKAIVGQLREKIGILLTYVNMNVKDRGFYDYWLKDTGGWDSGNDENEDEDEDVEQYSEGESYAEELTDWYYSAAQPLLMPAIEAYFQSHAQPAQTIENGSCPPW